MACTDHAPALAAPVAMTRCECAEASFEELARRMCDESLAFEDLTRRTGCGTTCTACLPDLQRYLDQR